MRPIRGRHWNRHNHSRRVEEQFERCFPMHLRRRTPAHNGEMSVRRQGSRIPWANDLPIRSGTPEPQDPEILANTQVPSNEERTIFKWLDINKWLDNACDLWLKQPLPNRQYVLMTNANFKNAGYALMTEENPEQKLTSTKKTYAPVTFGSKTFSPSHLKMSIYAKEFLAVYFAFMEYSHILWGSSKPTIVLTDINQSQGFFKPT